MTELFVGEDKLYKGYEDLDEVIEELTKKGENITDEERK